MSALLGYFVSSPREGEKRDRGDTVEEMKERERETDRQTETERDRDRERERERETESRKWMKVKKQKKLEMCQYNTDAPA